MLDTNLVGSALRAMVAETARSALVESMEVLSALERHENRALNVMENDKTS